MDERQPPDVRKLSSRPPVVDAASHVGAREGSCLSRDLLVIGHAKVPVGSAMHSSGRDLLTICLRVDQSGKVVEVDTTAMTGLLQRWLSELLSGRDFAQPLDDVLTIIASNFIGAAGGPIRQALVDAWRRYQKYLQDTDTQ